MTDPRYCPQSTLHGHEHGVLVRDRPQPWTCCWCHALVVDAPNSKGFVTYQYVVIEQP